MSRWIDADAVITRIAGQMSYEIEVETGNETDCIDLAEELLNDLPSIDIVRCGECKYWKSTVQMPNGTEVKCLYGRKADDFCSYGSRSEKPNNCEHITEDGVTCAKYPACDDCLDNPLNKVKGSERLLKGSEQTDCGWAEPK